MQFPQRLREATLGDVLAILFRARASGVLELTTDRCVHPVHLRGGLVLAVEGATHRLGELAVEFGCTSPAEVERAWCERRPTQRIGQCLVAAHVLTPRARDRLLDAQRAARLEGLFRLTDATLVFCPLRPLPEGAAEQVPMLASQVIRGRPRTRDRGLKATENPVRAEALAALGLAPDATEAEARARFRALVMELHPDRCTSAPPGVERLNAVLEAWRRLHAA